MAHQAILARFGQVVRQQQHARGAQALGFLCEADGRAGRAACASQDRHLAAAGVDRSLDHIRVLAVGQREELAGATGCEQRAGAVRRQPFQAFSVGFGTEVTLFVEVGHRERQ